MKFQKVGDIVLLYQGHVFYRSDTKAANATKCVFDPAQGILLYDANDKIVWRAIKENAKLPTDHFWLSIQREGNIKIFKSPIGPPPQYALIPDFNAIWRSNIPPFPILNLKEKCGCSGNGREVVITDHSLLKWKVRIKHTTLYNGPTVDYQEFVVAPVSNFYIGCTKHECTSIAPAGYNEMFEIAGYEIVE